MMAEFVLEMKTIDKSFFGVKVLKDVDFSLRAGEVHVLLGQNGAGKSTLIKILSGAYRADDGEFTIDGNRIDIAKHTPRAAEELGVATVYQNFHLIPHLTVAENLSFDSFTRSRGLVRWRRVRAHARDILGSLDFDIDPTKKVKDISVSSKQMLEIAIAVSKNARILIMDEPTAALSAREAEALFVIIRRLKKRGIGIVYISHKLEEIRQIGDRVSILRDGLNVATVDPRSTDTAEIVALMVGKGVESKRDYRHVPPSNVLVKVRDVLNANLREPISFDVRAGEILGVTGLVGAGKTELARAIYGADPVESGTIVFNGHERAVRSPVKAVDIGLGYLPEDRDSHGLFLNLSVGRNIALGRTVKARRAITVSSGAERKLANDVVDSVHVKTRSIDDKVKYLSGGNKQKVILGRWLNADCTLLVLDEPTIGIDVGARQEIYDLVQRFVEPGDRSVLFVSSDMDEVLQVCDRILVMSGRRLVKELDPAKTDKQEIMHFSIVEQARATEGS